MIKDITIGQYYQTKSILHKLDPRTKIIGTFIYMLTLFIFDTTIGYILGFVGLIALMKLSNVPFRYIIRGLKGIVVLLLFTVICQLLLTVGGELVISWKFIRIYSAGIYNAIFITFRIVLLVLGSSLMTYTTSPNQLTDGFEAVLAPLKIFRIDVHEIAMIMSIALRFIPILLDEADRIMKAQMSRGADFEHGNIFERVRSIIPIIFPLFSSAFARACDLAFAMEARCYRGSEGRTKMKPLIYRKRDLIAYGIMLGYILLNIILKVCIK